MYSDNLFLLYVQLIVDCYTLQFLYLKIKKQTQEKKHWPVCSLEVTSVGGRACNNGPGAAAVAVSLLSEVVKTDIPWHLEGRIPLHHPWFLQTGTNTAPYQSANGCGMLIRYCRMNWNWLNRQWFLIWCSSFGSYKLLVTVKYLHQTYSVRKTTVYLGGNLSTLSYSIIFPGYSL